MEDGRYISSYGQSRPLHHGKSTVAQRTSGRRKRRRSEGDGSEGKCERERKRDHPRSPSPPTVCLSYDISRTRAFSHARVGWSASKRGESEEVEMVEEEEEVQAERKENNRVAAVGE